MQRELYKCLILIILATLTSCTKEEKTLNPEHTIAVVVKNVVRQTVPITIETIGHVTSPILVEIRPQVGGVLLDYHVNPGQMVQKGDLLITIDPRPFQAALERAEANLAKNLAIADFTKKRVERFSDLVKKEYISKLSYDEYIKEQATAEAQVKNDLAELSLARINLEYCQIKASITGRISNFQIDPGNVISPSDNRPLTEIRQISPIGVQFTIPQRDLQHLQRNKNKEQLKIDIILPHEGGEDYTDDSYVGKVHFIDNHIDPLTGSIMIKGMVENEEHLLWPGEFVIVKMQLKEKVNALVIPESAIQIGQKGPFVFIVNEDETVSLRPVILGEKVEDKRVVDDGVFENEEIVTTGHIHLIDGKKIIKL